MVNSRREQKNLWVDKDFLNWLKSLKAKKMLNGEEINNLGELTKLIVKTEAISDVENQILNNKMNNLRIKIDAKRLFK